MFLHITKMNIAASILLNGDILEQVREASATQYQNSADQELDKYLDSLDGRTQKLKNHLQELAAVNIDSEWLKTGISFLDKMVQLVTALTDKFGGLNIVLGAVSGTLLSLMGHGKIKKRGCQILKMPSSAQKFWHNAARSKQKNRSFRVSNLNPNIREKLFAAYPDPLF